MASDKSQQKTHSKKSPSSKFRAVMKTSLKNVNEAGSQRKKSSKNNQHYLDNSRKGKFPSHVAPMLATLIDKPFEEKGWLYEIKWDGYRTIAYIRKGSVDLKSRNDKSFNEKFYPVLNALSKIDFDIVLDGEVVVVDEKGLSNFGALQNWRSEADGELMYYVFDILWLNGKNLMELPLSERKEILNNVIRENNIIKISQAYDESGIEFFEASKKIGLEGIIAKKAQSIYHAGDRSKEWLKIKANKRQEMVVGGFTKNEDTSKLFSALLVGVFKDGVLHYTGKVGTGFNDKMQREMMRKFKPLIISKPAFEEKPDVNKPSRFRPNPPHAEVFWLEPKLVCEVNFTEVTSDGIMRHPSFEGLRIDKKASDVVFEKEKPAKKTVKEADVISRKQMIRKPGKSDRQKRQKREK
jgi:bifunctional non-homologous end joining protein LigD